MHDGAECTLSQFADDTERGGVADTPEGCAATQRDLHRLEKWADRNPTKFNKILHLGSNNPMHQYRLGIDQHGRKGPGGPDGQVECEQCALAAKMTKRLLH